ncbi:hypothetical protein D3C79_858680 [compost metagenome]
MRIDHEFLRYARIELTIAFRRLIQADHLHADNFSNVDAVPHDCLHQLAVVLHYRGLACVEAVRFGPAQTETNAQRTDLGGSIMGTRIFRHIQTWNTDFPGDASDLHQ